VRLGQTVGESCVSSWVPKYEPAARAGATRTKNKALTNIGRVCFDDSFRSTVVLETALTLSRLRMAQGNKVAHAQQFASRLLLRCVMCGWCGLVNFDERASRCGRLRALWAKFVTFAGAGEDSMRTVRICCSPEVACVAGRCTRKPHQRIAPLTRPSLVNHPPQKAQYGRALGADQQMASLRCLA
jgi:hypothetical protein